MKVWGFSKWGSVGALLAVCLGAAGAQGEETVNLYSSRHYDTDERLYSEFEDATGIRVVRIEDKASPLIERIKAEGELSPADVFLTADAGRLWAAEQEDLFAPVASETLNARIPENLRHPDGLWFGFSKRARVIFYDKAIVDPATIPTYASLADPSLKGLVCTRSSSNIYMISLLASRIAHSGPEAAETWATGLWANRAREPEGGDTDQLRGIASGQCAIAVANTYYFARALRKDVRGLANPDDTDRIGIVFPDQDGTGAHVNISGGGLLKNAPNRENAIKFLEYLASDGAQTYFAAGNDEYPVVEGLDAASHVEGLGDFKADGLPLDELGRNQAGAVAIYNEVGYK